MLEVEADLVGASLSVPHIARAALLIAGVLFCGDVARAGVVPEKLRVTTISGSGVSGIADGTRTDGRLLMPFGVFADHGGRVYVADAAAQRVRVIESNGSIRTIAGSGVPVAGGLWVRGGFRDGPGSQAEFDQPEGVVARGTDVYVADSNNRCIRRIDASGNVSTYAGVPGKKGFADGPRLSATFTRPTGISADARGNLYVADYFAIRVISAEGDVKTIPNFTNTVFGVSVVDTVSGPVIFASDVFGIVRRGADGTVERYATVDHLNVGNRNIQGIEQLGNPFGIAAFDDHSVVFTDPRSNTVRYLNWIAGDVRTIGGMDVLDAAASSGGYRDGDAERSLFGAPLGITITGGGAIIVADAGSKRVRKITGLDRSRDATQGVLIPKMSQGGFKIGFVGNSYLWEYTRWSDSIQGIVEERLTRKFPRANIRVVPYVYPGAPFGAEQQSAEFLGSTGIANFVVLNLNPLMLSGTAGLGLEELDSHGSAWMPAVTNALRRTNDALKSRHVGFVVAVSPLPDEVSSAETVWNQITGQSGNLSPRPELISEMNAAVRSSGTPLLDVSEIFERDERSAYHAPLFGTQDTHFSRYGRAVMADAIVKYLLTLHPWILNGHRPN